jgi:hypothetical protein
MNKIINGEHFTHPYQLIMTNNEVKTLVRKSMKCCTVQQPVHIGMQRGKTLKGVSAWLMYGRKQGVPIVPADFTAAIMANWSVRATINKKSVHDDIKIQSSTWKMYIIS